MKRPGTMTSREIRRSAQYAPRIGNNKRRTLGRLRGRSGSRTGFGGGPHQRVHGESGARAGAICGARSEMLIPAGDRSWSGKGAQSGCDEVNGHMRKWILCPRCRALVKGVRVRWPSRRSSDPA